MSDDLVARFKNARNWINGGRCCGQVDNAGICAAPACIFGDAARELAKAADEITSLRAALATARRDALAEIKQDTDELIEQGKQDGMEQAAQWHDEQAAQAQKLSDMKVSALDAKVWGDYAANHREYAAAIRAAAGEVK